MNWIDLANIEQLGEIKELSKLKPQVIFKHSTRCSISNMAKNRLERNVLPENINFYYLDLLKHRAISDKIAADFNIEHESPQVLLIKNTVCTYAKSHSGINTEEIIKQLEM